MATTSSSLHGVSLAHYAAVRAALAEGFALDEVFAVEGVKARAWKKADVAWKKMLAGDPALFGEFENELAEAEDWLARRVKPLDDDPAAWVSFLHVYMKSADPIGLLAGAGLGLNDVARLERRWARRVEEDASSIGKKLAELARAPRGLPRIDVEPKVLRRSRVAEGRLAAEAATANAKDDGPASVVRRRWLEAHRAVLRGLAQKAVQVEPDVAPSPAPLPLPPLPHRGGVNALQATSLALDVPRGPALPFVEGTSRASPVTANVAEPKPARTAESLSGTALVVDVPRGPALPFAGSEGAAIAEKVVAVQKAPSGLAETLLALDVPRGPALPFQAGAEAPEGVKGVGLDVTAPVVAVPRGPALPFGEMTERAPRDLGETAPVVAVPRGPALPFGESAEKGAATASGRKAPPGAQELAVTAPIVNVPTVGALPFVRELEIRKGAGKERESDLARTVAFELPAKLRSPGATGGASTRETAGKMPELSLEQYAALCAELAASPGRAEETFARYGLTALESRRAVDEAWKERLRREPELYRRWQSLYQSFRR